MNDLSDHVRRVDEDRWLASRFAPAFVRERLIAIYAVNYELARISETVSEAALGDIRLKWWREAFEEILKGAAPRPHPALEGLARTIKDPVHVIALEEVAAARAADFEAQPFATWGELDAYVDATAGALMEMCIEQCAAPGLAPVAFVQAAARAWGYTGLARAAAGPWRARGRLVLPRAGDEPADMLKRARENYDAARAFAPSLPPEMFPAVGYVALVPGYLRALARGQIERSRFRRQVALIAASATGRL